MPAEEKLISADSHVLIKDEMLKKFLPSNLHSVWDEGVKRYYKWEETELRKGLPPLGFEDFVDLEAVKHPGHWDPEGRLRAMDQDGVQAEVMYTDPVGRYVMFDPRYMGPQWKEISEGYNDALAEFASYNPNRLLVAYEVPVADIDFAVKMVNKLAKKGARTIQMTPFPRDYGMPEYHEKHYDKLWGLLSETGIAITHHLAVPNYLWETFRFDPTPQKGIFTVLPAMVLAERLAFWILTGTLDRYPQLKIVFVESNLGWLPFFFSLLDMRMHEHYEFPGVNLMPSEYFKRQIWATFVEDPVGLKQAVEWMGPEKFMWSTDFPHPACTWPKSHEKVDKQFLNSGISAADRRKLVFDNAARVFGVPV